MINIENVLKTIENGYSLDFEFGAYSKIYMHTTENIKEFFEAFSPTDKKILTVAGSGDQLLNAYALSAKNVDLFDINPLAKCGVDLKVSCAKVLSYEEFIHFFFSEYSEYFSLKTYKRIYDLLDNETKLLFDALISKYGDTSFLKKIYYQMNPTEEKMKEMNIYLDEYYYYILQKNLQDKSFNFITSPLLNLKEHLTDKYDLILLSNISDAINNMFKEESLKQFKRLIHSLTKCLNNNGTMEVGYIYSNYHDNKSDFVYSSKREEVFAPDEFSSMLVHPYENHASNNRIIYYTKKK